MKGTHVHLISTVSCIENSLIQVRKVHKQKFWGHMKRRIFTFASFSAARILRKECEGRRGIPPVDLSLSCPRERKKWIARCEKKKKERREITAREWRLFANTWQDWYEAKPSWTSRYSAANAAAVLWMAKIGWRTIRLKSGANFKETTQHNH